MHSRVGDSSLSDRVQAIAATDSGKYRSAEEYPVEAAAVDMADNRREPPRRRGRRLASGTWMAVVYAFAGYRWRTRGPEFCPMLPSRARRLRIPLLLHGSLLDVDIEEHRVTYSVREGRAGHRAPP